MNPQKLRRPLRKRTKIETTTAMPIGPSTPRVDLRFLEEVCAQVVASEGQASLRRRISETDLLISEEGVNQTFACGKEDLVGITGLCGPAVDELLLANVRDQSWDTEQYLSEVLVAGFEESERKTSEEYWKVFVSGTPCIALRCTA